ncbi:nuclear pore complex protein Nup160-like [Tubulanus polymorphus]|uniref:nuclear pore complex protein Nup160-like n=1 Tax=Tubulanus polymorphus TaxID=672921 RepID=UPI003DA6346F
MAAPMAKCFREIIQINKISRRSRDITINTGGAPGPLQDIKLQESAGGYTYRDSSKPHSPIHNRFLYWRIQDDVVEFTEQSLDLNLHAACVQFRFDDTPVLGSISIFETQAEVVILVCTVSSVHKLFFTHPTNIRAQELSHGHSDVDSTARSIFFDATSARCMSHSTLSNGSSAYQVHSCASLLVSNGSALFSLATNSGSILLVRMPANPQDGVIQVELKESSMMQRLWTGLVPSVIRGSQETSSDVVLSMCLYPVGSDVLIFAVCKDHKIRIWSTLTCECLSAVDMLEYVSGNSTDASSLLLGARGHIIKCASVSVNGPPLIAVFLSFSDHCQFCIVQPALTEGRYHLKHVSNLFSPNEDLVDFVLTADSLWSVWMNSEGETFSRYVTIYPEGNWKQVHLEPSEDSELIIPPNVDPRQAYIQQLFAPGKFSSHAIYKALNIYRRSSSEANLTSEHNVSMTTLKEDVMLVVENEIQMAASEYELAEDEYYHLQIQHWGKFYSSCVQYQECASKCVGIFADSLSGFVSLVKKNSLSVLRPCDLSETLAFALPGSLSSHDLETMHILISEPQYQTDLINLVDCVKVIGSQMNYDIISTFEQELCQLEDPASLSHQVVAALLPQGSNTDTSILMKEISLKIENINNLLEAFDHVLQGLDVTNNESKSQPNGDNSYDDPSWLINASSKLYSSDLATALITRSLMQLIDTRFEFARDLLILQAVLAFIGGQCGLRMVDCNHLLSHCIPRTSVLVRAYYLMSWMSKTVATVVPSNTVEFNLRAMAALDLSDGQSTNMSDDISARNPSLLELFLRGIGSTVIGTRNIASRNGQDPAVVWTRALPFLWPLSGDLTFPEFMVSKCQFVQLQEYVRLLADWCPWNNAGRVFLLGQAYLNTGESTKALNCFLEAAHSIPNDEFLTVKLLQIDLEASLSLTQIQVIYYLKVIKLFEQFNYPDIVISLTTVAIDVADLEDKNLPTLWSKKFKHHLELGHNDEAYSAMIDNPDGDRRKDCLRQFLVILCERNQLKALVEYPYIDMEEDVVSIMESRARSVDLMTHNYYDLLYSFHVLRGNYRKAGSVMYEYGMRLGQEVPNSKGIQSQARCYLAAMNALRLVDEKYAWIATPSNIIENDGDKSPKRSSDGEEFPARFLKRRLDVLELADIEKDYMLIQCRLELIQKDPNPSYRTGPTPSADEMTGLLVTAGLFDQAVKLCQKFDMKLDVVFEGLTSWCVWLAQGAKQLTSHTADIFTTHSDISDLHTTKELSASDQCWQILQKYLENYEEQSSTRYHRCVVNKLLLQAFALPSWLINSYKLRDMSQLLRLLLDYDLLDESITLVTEYIDAILGKGKEYFGLNSYLHGSGPPCSVWLPYTSIDQLYHTLEESAHRNDHIAKLYEKLNDKLTEYFDILDKASSDKLTLTFSTNTSVFVA